MENTQTATTTTKRQDYLSWDDYFMGVAFLSAMRSKDPRTQVGACIVNSEKKIVGIGYNGFPMGCSDDDLPWDRENDDILETKYPYVCHAEMNAILNKNSSSVKGCTLYVALFPCNECAKLVIQSGISRVVYLSDKYHHDWKSIASRKLFDLAKIEYVQHQMNCAQLTIDFVAHRAAGGVANSFGGSGEEAVPAQQQSEQAVAPAQQQQMCFGA